MLRAAIIASFLTVSSSVAPLPFAPFAQAYDQIAAAQAHTMLTGADRKDWGGVLNEMALSGDPAARDLGMWRILSAGEGGWRDYRDFVTRNPNTRDPPRTQQSPDIHRIPACPSEYRDCHATVRPLNVGIAPTPEPACAS
mgnify:CR=1 FL=1